MHAFTALFLAASVALQAQEIDSAEVLAAPVGSSETIPPHNESLLSVQTASPLRYGRKRTGLSLVVVAVLASTVAAVFLLLHCFKVLNSSGRPSNYGLNERKLAEGDSDPCDVGLCHQISIPYEELGEREFRRAGSQYVLAG